MGMGCSGRSFAVEGVWFVFWVLGLTLFNGTIYSTSSPRCHFPGPFTEDFNGTEEPDCAESAKPEWCSDKWCCLVKGVRAQISDQFPSEKVMFERPSERSKTVFTTP